MQTFKKAFSALMNSKLKIFVMSLSEVIRIRTGETGNAAV